MAKEKFEYAQIVQSKFHSSKILSCNINNYEGPSDQMTGFIHDSKLQPNHSTTAIFESSTSQRLNPETVYLSMRQVVLEHPRLSIAYIRTLERSGHKRHAVQLSRLDLRECISFVDDSRLQPNDLLEKTEYQWFKRESLLPQWQLVVLNGKDVIFLFNHLACDGLSTMAFYRSLLSALNESKSISGSELDNLVDPVLQIPEMPLVESPFAKFERDTPMICMLGNAFREVFRTALISVLYHGKRQLFYDFRHSKYQRRRGDEVMSKETQQLSHPKYENVKISNEMMAKLARVCKEHGTTFTGLLHTLIIAIQSSYVYPSAKIARSRIAVSYRRYSGTPNSVMTDEVGNIYWGRRLKDLRGVFMMADPVSMWDIIWNEARKYKDYVKGDLDNEEKHAKINGHAKFMGQTDEKITKTMGLLGQQRHRTLEISNLGVFSQSIGLTEKSSPQSSEAWRITGYSFNSAPSHRSFGSSISVGIVSMEAGDCNINIGYDGYAIDEYLIQHFASLLHQKLKECSAADDMQEMNVFKELI